MKPAVKKFDKASPCTASDIWKCFRGRRGFKRVQIAVAESIIGENTPRFMIKAGKLTRYEQDYVEYYELTDFGRKWLLKKFKKYLQKYPETLKFVDNVPAKILPKCHRV